MNGAAELAAKKQWKQKKISIHDFREIFGTCIVKVGFLFYHTSCHLVFDGSVRVRVLDPHSGGIKYIEVPIKILTAKYRFNTTPWSWSEKMSC